MPELHIRLENGATIITGGEEHAFGAYVTVLAPNGEERAHWDKREWAEDPECVMGAILAAAAGFPIPFNSYEREENDCETCFGTGDHNPHDIPGGGTGPCRTCEGTGRNLSMYDVKAKGVLVKHKET